MDFYKILATVDIMINLINEEKAKEITINLAIMKNIQPRLTCNLIKNLSYSMKKECKKYSVYPEGYIDLEALENIIGKVDNYFNKLKDMGTQINGVLKEGCKGTISYVPENYIPYIPFEITIYEALVLYKVLNNLIRGSENFKYTTANYDFYKGIIEELRTQFINAFYALPL